MKHKTCSSCKQEKPISEFYKNQNDHRCKTCNCARMKERYKKNPEKYRESALRSYRKFREDRIRQHKKREKQRKDIVFTYYGGYICACCGEDEQLFLTIDHVNNDGADHRREMGTPHQSGQRLYRWLVKNGFPDGFQVLCMNCNYGKHQNGGVCPHEKAKSSS